MASEKKIFKVLSIVSLLELYVAMATRVPIQLAQKPNASFRAFPLPDDASHEI